MAKRKLTPAQKRMTAAVASLTEYMKTYTMQAHYQDYSDRIFIDDVLYGLGLALSSETYAFGDGYEKFKARLRAHLGADPTDCSGDRR